MISKDKKMTASQPFKQHQTDTGGTAVQIAVMTARINDLTHHLNTNSKDYTSRLGLLKLVGQRRRLLNYLSRTDEKQYQKVIQELKLRK
ncbi:MAG: 30S ribosomal protein S15 [Elusimicrobia bacterium]|nr:30S ribosomal protein S15 [Candidatus Obscuribacterium magneticum]